VKENAVSDLEKGLLYIRVSLNFPFLMGYISTLKMEAAGASETFVPTDFIVTTLRTSDLTFDIEFLSVRRAFDVACR
jgi:hypothetical protein